jgi:hypothetical protein
MSDKKKFELANNTGYLFKNSFKDYEDEKDSKKPDYQGDFNVNGEVVKVSLWKNRTQKGDVMLKLGVFTPKGEAKPTNEALSADDLPF